MGAEMGQGGFAHKIGNDPVSQVVGVVVALEVGIDVYATSLVGSETWKIQPPRL
jgi:hypothetical protein